MRLYTTHQTTLSKPSFFPDLAGCRRSNSKRSGPNANIPDSIAGNYACSLGSLIRKALRKFYEPSAKISLENGLGVSGYGSAVYISCCE